MITKLARIANAALRERWSTVIIVALLLTAIRAVQDWNILSSDPITFFAKLFATLIISTIFSLGIHIILYIVFSPSPHPAPQFTPEPQRAPAQRQPARTRSASRAPTRKTAAKRKKK
jgi:hypothetical protein